jgi:hypothetical protein
VHTAVSKTSDSLKRFIIDKDCYVISISFCVIAIAVEFPKKIVHDQYSTAEAKAHLPVDTL